MLSTLTSAFAERYGAPPALVVRAPGRVNLIGEHTDYNDGFVLPMAVDRAAWIALRPRDDGQVRVASLDFGGEGRFALDALGAGKRASDGWLEYVRGMAWAIQAAGHTLRGWEGVLAGDVPLGAGLSSSAAVELAVARAFASVSAIPWDARQMARLAQRAENEWVGVACGIMDQLISAAGKAGHALLIDCRSLATESVPLPDGSVVVVMDTATRRELVTSAYNERRAQCSAAAAALGVPALRDITVERFALQAARLEPLIRRRARHVISENARTVEAAHAMRANDPATVGRLMNESHASLRDDFEVSSPALDAMVAIAQQMPGCFGARMTGGGFGGCAVALVRADAAAAFVEAVDTRYRDETGLIPSLYLCRPSDGASVVASDDETS